MLPTILFHCFSKFMSWFVGKILEIIMGSEMKSIKPAAADNGPYHEFCIVDEHFVQFGDTFGTAYEKRVVERFFSLHKTLW